MLLVIMTNNGKDEQLIGLLRENARLSVSDLARRLNVSRTAAQVRLEKLERSGVIAGYSALVRTVFSQAG